MTNTTEHPIAEIFFKFWLELTSKQELGNRGGQTSFLEHCAVADGSSKLVAGEALVDAFMLLNGRILDVDRANSRHLPNVDAGYDKWLAIFPPLVTTPTITHPIS